MLKRFVYNSDEELAYKTKCIFHHTCCFIKQHNLIQFMELCVQGILRTISFRLCKQIIEFYSYLCIVGIFNIFKWLNRIEFCFKIIC